MIIRYPKTSDPGRPGKDEKGAGSPAGEDECRCKEASNMSPGQLFRLMVSDLAFWKKMKTPRS